MQSDPALRDVLSRVKHRRLVPLLSGAAVFAIVAIWTFVATPRYKSTALLRIASAASAATPLLDQLQSVPGIGLMGLGRDELETEVGVLRSRRLAEAVIDSLALTVRVSKPTGARDSVLTATILSPDDVDGILTFQRSGEGAYSVTAEKLIGADAPAGTYRPGDSLRVGSVRLRLAPTLATSKLESFTVRLSARYKALKQLDDRLDIRQQEGGSRLVQVAYEDADRLMAARAVNRLVADYVAYSNANELGDDALRAGELRRATDSVARVLAQAEVRLKVFKETQKLLLPDEQATQQLKRIAVLRTQLDGLEVERNALARMLDIVANKSKSGADPAAYRQLATFPSLITNRAIQDYLANLVDLENKRSELGVRRTSENAEMQQFTLRIAELEQQLDRIGSQYLESLEQQIAVATQSVRSMSGDLDVFPRQEMDYVRLVRDRTLANEAYIMLQKQLKQAELTTAMRTERVRVVDVAQVANPKDREFPKVAVQLLLGLVLGAAVALTVAFSRELLGPSVIQASVSANQNTGSDRAP